MSIHLLRLVKWGSSVRGSESRTKESPRSQHAMAIRPGSHRTADAISKKELGEAEARVEDEGIRSR